MSESPSLSPREYLTAALALMPRAIRAAWIGAVVLAIGLGVTAAVTLSTPRLYRSEAVIVYERGVRAASVSNAESDSSRDVSTRLHDMLTGRQRLERAIKEMKLYQKEVDRRGVLDAIEEMRKHITVGAREGYAFKVSYDAPGRELTQQVLDWLLKGVVEEDAQKRVREADETKRFLDAERKHVDEDLKAKESMLAGFLTKHPQLAGETGGSAASAGGLIRAADRDRMPTNSGGEVAALELQAAQLEDALAVAGARAGTTANGEPAGPPGDPVLTAARSRAHAELQTAQRDLIEKQARFTLEHPDVKAALRHVALAEATLRQADAALEAARASAPAPNAATPAGDDGTTGRAAALRRALASVRAQIAGVKTRSAPRPEPPRTTSSVVEIDTEWTRLNRDISDSRERLVQLEGKQFQAQLQSTLVGGGQGGRLVVTDPPYRPTRPIAGGRFKISLVGGMASVLLSLIAIAILAAFDDRLYSVRDIERIVRDGIVIVVPKLTGKSG